jgi:hypothetical protein
MALTAPARAYLDPGSGSYLLQILLAGVVAALFTVKLFWLRIVTFVTSHLGRRRAGGRSDE